MNFCHEIIDYMEKLAPSSLAESWDNTGLLLGSPKKVVIRILLCLDVTGEIAAEALANNIDMIIAHHPLIFKKISRIIEDDFKGGLIYKLIRADICVFCAHTNLDVVEAGVNAKLAEKLELTRIMPLKKDLVVFEGKPTCPGLGAVGFLKESMDIEDFVEFVKEKLETANIRMVGTVKGTVNKVAVFCGSFDDDLEAVLDQKADVLVTGDLKYHTAVDAAGLGMCIIDAGHFNTEKVILPVVGKLLQSEFPGIELIYSKMALDPFKTY